MPKMDVRLLNWVSSTTTFPPLQHASIMYKYLSFFRAHSLYSTVDRPQEGFLSSAGENKTLKNYQKVFKCQGEPDVDTLRWKKIL